MKSNYRKLGEYIREVNIRNTDLRLSTLLGVSVTKEFIPSIANTVGTDFSKYKIVKRNQFTYIPDTSRRGDKIGVALLQDYDEALVSQAYTVFEVSDEDKLNPEYLMMWFRRPEFDRYARFKSEGSVREIFSWSEMCNIELPVPDIEKQRKIVEQYNQINKAIQIKEAINNNLEEQAQAIFKSWFVDYKPFGGIKPDSWNEISFSDIADFINGYSYQGDELQESNYAMATIKNFNRDGGFKLDGFKEIIPSNKLRKNQEVNIFDVLVAHTDLTQNAYVLGNAELLLSKNKYEKIIMSMDLVKVTPKTNEISTFLLAAILKNKEFKTHCLRYKSGTTVLHLSKRALPEYRLTFPNNLEDIKPLEKILSEIYKTTAKNIEESASLLKLRDTLLPKLMLENSDSSTAKLSFI